MVSGRKTHNLRMPQVFSPADMENQRNRHDKAYAVVLAAGQGRRFGSNKQLATLDGEPLVRRAARLAQAVCGDRSLLVTGFEPERTQRAAGGLCNRVSCNANYASGMASSLRHAAELLRDEAAALLVILADQPLVTSQHLESLLQCWSGSAMEIVASSYGDTRGAPVLLPDGCFADLLQLGGDRGAQVLFEDSRFVVSCRNFEPAAIDVDTVADLERLNQPPA